MPDFYDAGPLAKIAINLFNGWGYNFYRKENQLRADDLLIRSKVGALLGMARKSLESAQADYRTEFLPEPTRERPDFEQVAPNYYKRFETVVEEDNQAMAIQFAGLNSPFAQRGRFSIREILAHHIDNWILDQVLSRNT